VGGRFSGVVVTVSQSGFSDKVAFIWSLAEVSRGDVAQVDDQTAPKRVHAFQKAENK